MSQVSFGGLGTFHHSSCWRQWGGVFYSLFYLSNHQKQAGVNKKRAVPVCVAAPGGREGGSGERSELQGRPGQTVRLPPGGREGEQQATAGTV